MLKQIVVEGVKSFHEQTSIDFAPLSIITGVNSSGKSTIFQTLLLLKQAFTHPPTQFAGFYLNGPLVSVGDYIDWSTNFRGYFLD